MGVAPGIMIGFAFPATADRRSKATCRSAASATTPAVLLRLLPRLLQLLLRLLQLLLRLLRLLQLLLRLLQLLLQLLRLLWTTRTLWPWP